MVYSTDARVMMMLLQLIIVKNCSLSPTLCPKKVSPLNILQ